MARKSKDDLILEALELGIDDAESMTVAQLEVSIEESKEPRITIKVPRRVVTIRGIVVPKGRMTMSKVEFDSSGLAEHQYTLVEDGDAAPAPGTDDPDDDDD